MLADGSDEVLGILMAKDLLFLAHPDRSEKFNLRDLLRPASGIPESKRLNVLLRSFAPTEITWRWSTMNMGG